MAEDEPGTWHDVAARDQLDPDIPVGVDVADTKVGLFLLNDQVYALEDVCPHANALLSEGYQEDGEIECPLHAARFDIASGKCLNEIGERDLKCYAVKVEGGRVSVKMPVASGRTRSA